MSLREDDDALWLRQKRVLRLLWDAGYDSLEIAHRLGILEQAACRQIAAYCAEKHAAQMARGVAE